MEQELRHLGWLGHRPAGGGTDAAHGLTEAQRQKDRDAAAQIDRLLVILQRERDNYGRLHPMSGGSRPPPQGMLDDEEDTPKG